MNKLLILGANGFSGFVCAVHGVAETFTELAICLFQCSSLDKTQLMLPRLRGENSIIPESDLSFGSIAALQKQLRSQLCACFPSTTVKPKFCAILSGIIKSSLLSIVSGRAAACSIKRYV